MSIEAVPEVLVTDRVPPATTTRLFVLALNSPSINAAASTLAPLLTTNWLALPELPTVRLTLLLQTEPVPVTITILLFAIELLPTVPAELNTRPPLVISSWLAMPELPTVRVPLLPQIEPASATTTALLLPVPRPIT